MYEQSKRRWRFTLCSRVNGCPISIIFIKSSCEWQSHTQVCVRQPLELPVVATGSWPLRRGSLSLSLAEHQAASWHRRLQGVQGLSYHKFLDSPDQEQGVWSRFRNNRWSTSRDWFWRRMLPNPSVRNSRSFFFPLIRTWQPPLLGTFSWSVFRCHGHRWLFAEQFLLRPCEASRRNISQKNEAEADSKCVPLPYCSATTDERLNSDLSIHACKFTNAFPWARGTLHKLNGGSLD